VTVRIEVGAGTEGAGDVKRGVEEGVDVGR
jgi:hypothetical protein